LLSLSVAKVQTLFHITKIFLLKYVKRKLFIVFRPFPASLTDFNLTEVKYIG